MSKISKNSTKSQINDSELQVDDISSSKSIFSNSLKRRITKTWYQDPTNEENKSSEKITKKINSNGSINKINENPESKKTLDEENNKNYDPDSLFTINKFNSLNFISSQSTNDMLYSNPHNEIFPITKSGLTNFSYNKFDSNEDLEIEDETITKEQYNNDDNELSKTNFVQFNNNLRISYTNVTKSRSCGQEINILKSANNLLNEFNKGNLNTGDYIFDESIRIIKYISEGAQAKVYLGLIEEIEKYVAIKRYVLMDQDENLIDKVTAECEVVKKLQHSNIIRYFDVEINYYGNLTTIDLIMEYVEGFSLKDFINDEAFSKITDKEEKLRKIKFIIKNILEGISYLHNNKIIHRDLKPENILITDDFEKIKIVDFGVSTKVKDSETYKSRSLLGTPWYMAPEVILEKPYAYEADIWSVGCILFELISGVKPYYDNNPFNAMLKMAQYTSPIEYADEEIKDIFYDKTNRILLDFLQRCWRANNIFRPSASEILEHQFLE